MELPAPESAITAVHAKRNRMLEASRRDDFKPVCFGTACKLWDMDRGISQANWQAPRGAIGVT